MTEPPGPAPAQPIQSDLMTVTDISSIRVLVVDDRRTMRDIIRRPLSQIGVRDVEHAADGKPALEKLHHPTTDKPDMVICDLHMAKMDGMDFCNQMRRAKNDIIRGLPINILTGEPDTFVHDVTKQLGTTTVRVKPVSAGNLKTKIEAAFGFTISPPREPASPPAPRTKRNRRPSGAAEATI